VKIKNTPTNISPNGSSKSTGLGCAFMSLLMALPFTLSGLFTLSIANKTTLKCHNNRLTQTTPCTISVEGLIGKNTTNIQLKGIEFESYSKNGKTRGGERLVLLTETDRIPISSIYSGGHYQGEIAYKIDKFIHDITIENLQVQQDDRWICLGGFLCLLIGAPFLLFGVLIIFLTIVSLVSNDSSEQSRG
jgi:hypothetical protein